METTSPTRESTKHFLVLLILLICAAAVFVTKWAYSSIYAARTGPPHVFDLLDTPKFLTDTLALAEARDAMRLERLSAEDWQPLEDHRTVAPDGKPDNYLVRNGINPNRGFIQFLNRHRSTDLLVTIELEENRVTCRITRPK